MSEKFLEKIVVVNLCQGMSAALISKLLSELGASVLRPDMPSDQIFSRIYPAWESWTRYEKKVPALGEAYLQNPIWADADVCLLGGKDFPGVSRTSGAKALSALHSRLIAVEVASYPEGLGKADRPAVDILMQAASGLVGEQFEDRPIMMGFKPSIYGATLLALMGTVAALIERLESDQGQAVETSLYEGAVLWRSPFWFHAEHSPPGRWLSRPKNAKPLIFKCEDGVYIHISLSTPGSMEAIARVLGMDEASGRHPDGKDEEKSASNFFGDTERMAPLIAGRSSKELLSALRSAGLDAEACLRPGECWNDPQVTCSHIIEGDELGRKYVGNPIKLRTNTASVGETLPKAKSAILENVRVLDLGTFVAGPLASVALGDLGADVIKIEPLKGDPTRTTFWWNTAVNRGKRNIQIDLKTDEGREIFKRLCATAQLVTNNFRVGVTERLKIGSSLLQSEYPGLSILEAPAYGMHGPKALESGVDMTMQAWCGHEYRAGGEGNPPLWNRLTFVDIASGCLGSIAGLLCLYHRSRTGEATLACVPLLNGALYMLSELVGDKDGKFHGAPPINATQTGVHAGEALYQTQDGWVAVAARDSASKEKLAKAFALESELPGLTDDWGDDESRKIAGAFRKLPNASALAILEENGIWAEPVDNSDLWSKKDSIDLYNIHDPDFGTVYQVRSLFRLSRSPKAPTSASPEPGQNTREILTELGFDGGVIEDFFARKIVQ